MSATVENLLRSLDTLPAAERHELVVEILRRELPVGDISEASLVEAADALFCCLDAEENCHGQASG